MFKCSICSKTSVPGEKLNKLVSTIRPVKYVNDRTQEGVSEGWEIDSEINSCSSCLTIGTIIPKKNLPVERLVTVRYKPLAYERGAGGEGYLDKSDRNEQRRREFR